MVPDTLTSVNSLGIGITILMGFLFVILPRKYTFVPLIVLICYMTMGEAVAIGAFHFTMLRILILFGWTRVILRGELRAIHLNSLDRILLWFMLSGFVAYLFLWHDSDAVVYELGQVYNTIGFYFLFRMLIVSLDDIIRIFKFMAIMIVPLAGSMILEKSTGRNPFAIFGGVPPITLVRDGVLRCQGPFAHPILAGSFGACMLPFFIILWQKGFWNKALSIVGITSSLIITVTSGSSGPVLAAMAGVGALCMWRWRKQLRTVRWGIALTLLGLDIAMKAPIWFLLARLDIFSGSTGYHRAYLIDRAFANIGDWWIVGTKSTVAWADTEAGLFDVTNQYLVHGANGGLLTMLLFIWILVRGFRSVGLALRGAEATETRTRLLAIWALGAALFAHLVTFISVSYFDQNIVVWYILLAMIATVSDLYVATSVETVTITQNQPIGARLGT